MERFRVDGGTARDDFGQNFGTLVMERCGRNQGQISGVNDCVWEMISDLGVIMSIYRHPKP